jgi:hypothetical protein
MDGRADRSAVERRFQLCCGLASVFSISLSYTVRIVCIVYIFFLFVWLSLFTVKSILFYFFCCCCFGWNQENTIAPERIHRITRYRRIFFFFSSSSLSNISIGRYVYYIWYTQSEKKKGNFFHFVCTFSFLGLFGWGFSFLPNFGRHVITIVRWA